MKRNELLEIKKLSIVELLKRSRVIKKELANLVLDKNMRKLKDVKVMSKKRVELAQILTVARQKQMLEELEAKVKAVSVKGKEEIVVESKEEKKEVKPKKQKNHPKDDQSLAGKVKK